MSTTTYPCHQCGAKLEFAAGLRALKCPYCGSENQIAAADAEQQATVVEELDYHAWLEAKAADEPLLEAQTVKCNRCGAASTLGPNLTADRCPFCATPLIASQAYANRLIRPRGILPFKVPQDQAMRSFKDWIHGLWFAPSALKRAYRADHGLKGLYIPYWTYDSDTTTPYSGERGDNYYVTESYTENGVSKTRQVQKIRWYPVSGTVQVPFDDVLVPAATSLPDKVVKALEPWDLSTLEPYRDDFVSGFQVEAYQVGLEPGFKQAQAIMEDGIRTAIASDIGGDHQRIHSMQPNFANIRFKHQLLPIWLSTYRYANTVYRFLVNGQSGKVQGERPWSAWKIAFAVLGALSAAGVVIYLLQGQ